MDAASRCRCKCFADIAFQIFFFCSENIGLHLAACPEIFIVYGSSGRGIEHISAAHYTYGAVFSRAAITEGICVSTLEHTEGFSAFIIIDCMPSLGMMTINALAAADSVVIPSQPSFLSAKGLDLLLRSISKVKRSINPDLKIDGILLTMVDGRTNNAREIIESLRSTVGRSIRIFDTEIPHSVRAAECSVTGESIFAHDRNGKVAEAYEKLTKEVTELEGKTLNRSGHDWVR